MLAHVDDFGDRKTLADRIEGERVFGNVLILAACGAHQVLDADAGVEGAGNGAAVADIAKDDVAMQLHLYLLASIDTLGKGDPQSGAGDVEYGSVNWFGRAGKDFELGGIVRRVAGLAAAFGRLFRCEKRLRQSRYGMIELF